MVSGEMAPHLEHNQHSSQGTVPIVLCAAIWGSDWLGSRVHFRCDNWSVVQALTVMRAQESTCYGACSSSRHISGLTTRSHIPGKENSVADVLSRDNVINFSPPSGHQDAITSASSSM